MADSVQGESSSNSSNSDSSTSKWRFHVFLSFTGQDTRINFIDHLSAALWSRGIITFRDDKGMERGEVISQQLHKAIEDSLSAVVVLSRNYASSKWCLDELQKIMESRDQLNRQVFPIFYGVDPADVRHQRGTFAEAIAKHEERFKESQEKVQRWRHALTEVANLAGWDSRGRRETDLIKDIVGQIWTKVCSKQPSCNNNDNHNLVGIDSKIAEMNSGFGIGMDDIRFIGIWGMGGIGKTTLARAVYNKNYKEFDICCFLANVREASERDDQVHLQRRFLSHINTSSMVIHDTYEGKEIIQNLCSNKKVILVLDDVNDVSQLENLAEHPTWFGAGSRVIITTRDKHLLVSHEVHRIYEIKTMKEDESLQLFSRKAFKKDHPEESYLALSKSVVRYAGALPLALKALGTFLCGRSKREWEDALKRLKHIPNEDILQILKISYDRLNDEEKTIFLDIACFFKGWPKDVVTKILESCGLHMTIGLSVLIEKALLIEEHCVGGFFLLEMHDLLEELGKDIVSKEFPDACRRSRLWNLEDIDKVLKNNTGTETIQAIVLPGYIERRVDCHPEAFSKMSNLRLFVVSLCGDMLNFPCGPKCLSSALKVFYWRSCPLEALPLENGMQCLQNLKLLDLSSSRSLIQTPNFSGTPNLERLILQWCTSLVKVDPSLGKLNKLVELNLAHCINLETLPTKLEMNSLIKLKLRGCHKVTELPEFGKGMEKLLILDLEHSGITGLPNHLGS